MSEITLNDVLKAVENLGSKVGSEVQGLHEKIEGLRLQFDSEVVGLHHKISSEVRGLHEKVDVHRAETTKGFADLDTELSGHTEVHQQIEADIETLKRRPARRAVKR